MLALRDSDPENGAAPISTKHRAPEHLISKLRRGEVEFANGATVAAV